MINFISFHIFNINYKHCFPNGYQLLESNEIPNKNSFYFVLDNNHSSIDFPQKFIACLIFYEKLESYKKAYKKYQSDIDFKYSSYHIEKNSRFKRETKNVNYSNFSENDVHQSNNSNSNLNNYNVDNHNFNSNINFHNNNKFETEIYLNETNQNSSFTYNYLTNNINNQTVNNNTINEALNIRKNSINKGDNSIDFNNSDNSTNPNNTSTLNNLSSYNTNLQQKMPNSNRKNLIENKYTQKSISYLPAENKYLRDKLVTYNHSNNNLNINKQNELINNIREGTADNLDNSEINNIINRNNFTTNNEINNNYPQKISIGSRKDTISSSGPYFYNIRSNSMRSSYSSITTFTGIKQKIKNIFIPKCICLVSVHPFCNEMINILEAIYNHISSNTKLKKPLEKIIENLVIEVPLPPRGLYSINYELFDFTFNFKQSKMNELPYINFNLEQIFMHFDIDQTLEIFKHLLLETRMIFFSKDMKILTPIIHGFVTLIYPFKYPFNYITVIPEENFCILENVTPFIIGINQSYSENFFDKYGIDISEINFLVIDIDNKMIELFCYLVKNKDEALKKKIIKKEFPDLPIHYKTKLNSKIKEYFDHIKSERKNSSYSNNEKENLFAYNTNVYNSSYNQLYNGSKYIEKECNINFIKTIRNYFYQFMVSIFLNYAKFLNLDYYNNKFMSISIPSVRNLFKVDEFLNSVCVTDRLFYSKFILETQQFADFIYKRMIPKDSKEKLEILLFDEHITQKNNRKYFSKKTSTYFLNSEFYDLKSVYYVEKQRQLSDLEKKNFQNYENRKAALKYGQEIFIEKDGEISISYFYFPILMTNFYFYNNIKNYIIPRNLSEDLEQINIEMVSKSHLGKKFIFYSSLKKLGFISMKETVMENYIYLCWAQLWAMTFWYHDPEEKRYRFNQLLNVLDRLGQYEVFIFILNKF